MDAETVAIVAARNEADRLPATLRALRDAFPGVTIVVADDASDDDTVRLAERDGAHVVESLQSLGKGGNATNGARRALELAEDGAGVVFLLVDGDLADSAGRLGPLVDAVRAGATDISIAVFARKVGGGLGVAVGTSRWAIRRRTGLEMQAPISGQRALSRRALETVLPFAPRFGMETGMTIDAARAGLRVQEVEIDLEHRATGKTLRGFLHRGRQARDILAAYLRRR
jgi:glycosyltransferase involved in cell wall biosynthesis